MMTDQTDSQPRPVTFDLMADDDSYFVLTEALREFASRQRWEAEDDPTGNAESRVRWAGHAEGLLDRIEQALSLQTPQAETSRQQKALDHAREVLAVEETSSSLPDREWRRELRWALRDVVQAFPLPGTGHEQ